MRGGVATALGVVLGLSGCGQAADRAPSAGPSEVGEAGAVETAEVGAGAVGAEPAGPSVGAAAPAAAGPTETPPAPVPKIAIPVRLRALGTEPFWNARISGGMLIYTTPEDQKGQHAALTRRDLPNGAEFSGKLGGSAIRLIVTRAACSDGMSDRSYPFTAVLTIGADRRDGCAS